MTDRFIVGDSRQGPETKQLARYLKAKLGYAREVTLCDFDVERICDLLELEEEPDWEDCPHCSRNFDDGFAEGELEGEGRIEDLEADVARLENAVDALKEQLRKASA
ncbi:MAG: hypothetical protein AAF447_16565 [Myxococcota bacterium]